LLARPCRLLSSRRRKENIYTYLYWHFCTLQVASLTDGRTPVLARRRVQCNCFSCLISSIQNMSKVMCRPNFLNVCQSLPPLYSQKRTSARYGRRAGERAGTLAAIAWRKVGGCDALALFTCPRCRATAQDYQLAVAGRASMSPRRWLGLGWVYQPPPSLSNSPCARFRTATVLAIGHPRAS
jgi:hypothetical protein